MKKMLNNNTELNLHQQAEQLIKENKLSEAIICCQKLIKNEPLQPIHIYVKLAEALINSNRLEEAEAVFQELIVKYPHSWQGYNGLARLANKQKNWDLAFQRWSFFLEKFPDDIGAMIYKGNALLNLNKIEEAEVVFQEVIVKHPDRFNGYEELAKIAYKQENWDLAFQRWSHLLEKFPGNIGALVHQGNALLNLDKIDESEAIFQEIIAKYPHSWQGYDGIARLANKQQNWDLAFQRWSNFLEKFPGNIGAMVYQGNALLNLYKFDESKAIFQEIIAKYPDKMEGYNGLANIEMFKQNWTLAIEKWQKVTDKFPEYIGSFVNMANAFMNLGNFKEAEVICHKLIKNEPDKIDGYQGLINIAKRLGDWKLALETIEGAFDKFPEEKSLYVEKINALLQLIKFEEALNLIKQCQEKYADDVKFMVAEANFYARQFNYTESLKILELIKESGKADFGIEMLLARNYLLIGNITLAREIIENLQTKPQGKNNEGCQNLYVQLLMINKDYEQLKKYVKENLNNTKFSKQIIYDYINLLVSQESYQEAKNLINDIIQEKNDDPKIYKAQIKLVLLKEQIRNLESLNTIENYQQFKEKLGNSNQIISKLRNYLNDNPQHSELNDYLTDICDYFERLSEHKPNECFINTYLSLFDSYEIAAKIIQHIQNKKPLSFIRLSDGEGNFIEYEDEFKEYQEHDQQQIQRIWWGTVKIKKENSEKLISQYHQAINNTDILGITELNRFCRSLPIPIQTEKVSNRCNRGLRAINNYLINHNNSQINYSATSSVLSCNFISLHFEQWDLYRIIFSYLKEVSVISCHADITSILNSKYGIKVNKLYEIPSEYAWSHQFNHDKEYEQHYPTYYEKLCAEITVSYPGELFIVGAGFLGKIYCNIIKEKGGIALDLGSMIDYWLGYTTRPEQKNLLSKNCYSFLQKIIKTDPRIQKNEPNLNTKIINLSLYKSNEYCDQNIYQPTQLFQHWNLAQRKLFKIIGHSRCGSGFISHIFQQFGFDIGHEILGKDGIGSWLMTVKDLNPPWGDNHVSYYTRFDYIIHYIRNPQDAIPSIMVEHQRSEKTFNFRKHHIFRELNFDIANYKTPLERALASFLAWNKIAELQVPDLTLKVEDCINDLHTFLEEKSCSRKPTEEINQIVINNKINNTLAKWKQKKPQLREESYQEIAPELKEGLINFCESYGYDLSFLNIK